MPAIATALARQSGSSAPPPGGLLPGRERIPLEIAAGARASAAGASPPRARARRLIYWTDLAVSAVVAWTGITTAAFAGPGLAIGAMVVGILGLYRALCFIHELAHQPPSALPGFALAWHAAVGWPCCLPAATHVGMHLDHHAPATYGGAGDPEYLPLAGNRVAIIAIIAHSPFIPVAVAMRFILLTPLAWCWPWLSRLLDERASSFVLNPVYRRRLRERERRSLRRSEVVIVVLWWSLIAACLVTPDLWRWPVALAIALAGVTTLNAVRVLTAHGYVPPREPASPAEQATDAFDFTGGGLAQALAALWAPVGLRYHALHHLRPGLPYHALAAEHRRLAAAGIPAGGSRRGLWPALRACWSRRSPDEAAA